MLYCSISRFLVAYLQLKNPISKLLNQELLLWMLCWKLTQTEWERTHLKCLYLLCLRILLAAINCKQACAKPHFTSFALFAWVFLGKAHVDHQFRERLFCVCIILQELLRHCSIYEFNVIFCFGLFLNEELLYYTRYYVH